MSILIATDFSDNAKAALRAGSAEARRRNTTVTLLHCLDSIAEKWEFLDRTEPNARDRIKTAARDKLEEEFDEAVPREDQAVIEKSIVLDGPAGSGIAETADDDEFDLVVIGATGGGALARLVLGSTAEEVVRMTTTPTLVVPKKGLDSVDRILAPIDLSDCSEASLLAAAERARRDDAVVDILHVSSLPAGAMTLMEWEPSDEDRQAHKEFRSKQLQKFLDQLDLADIDFETHLRFGSPAREVVDFARESASDLIVMGTHGRRGFDRLFLGSTAAKVLRRMPCPVLAIPHRSD